MRHTRSGNPTFPAWKFEAPRLASCLLSRERLLSRVEQCLGKAKSSGDILLVSAPAGYGKSTLLAEWSLRTTLPVVWYHLDRSDQDPATFIRGIAHALRVKFPRPRWSVESVLNNLRVDLLADADLARVSSVLAADIEQHVSRPAVLVLTGVAELGARSPSLVVLDRLLSRPIDHLRVALEWREAPRVHFSALLAERRLSAIGSEDLRLTDGELEELLTLAGAPSDPVYREQVRKLCTGWVTGAMLAIGALLPEAASPLPAGELDHEAVVDYLAHQVIDVLPPALSTFASEAAVLTYMTPDLCARLFGLPVRTARERLGALERSTGFLTRSGQRPQELVYRFQPLLRQALLARLGGLTGGKARRRDLHLRAGMLLQGAGDVDAAIWQYRQVRSYDRIADLIEEVESEYLRASRGLLLARWLDLLPAAVYHRRPHLQLLQAELYRQTGRGSRALKLVERLERRLSEPDAGPSGMTRSDALTHQLAAHALVINAEVQHHLGRYQEAKQACAEALDRLSAAEDAGAEEGRLETLYARAYENLAATVLLTDGPEAAEPHLRACERHMLYSGDLWKVGRHHYQRSKTYMWEGNFARAESAAVAALLAAEEAHDEIYAVASRLNLGAIKMRLGRTGEAREELATALDEARAVGYTLGEVYALGNLADLALSCGDYPEAIALYEETFQVLGAAEDTHFRLCASAGLGYALTLAGRPEEAIVRLTPLLGEFPAISTKGAESKKMAERHGTADEVLVALSLGFAYLRHGLGSFAEEIFARAADEAARHGQTLKSAQAHLFLAAVQVNEFHQAEAEVEILAALEIALSAHDGLALAVELRRVPEVWPLLERLDQPLAADLMRAVRAGSQTSRGAVQPPETALLPAAAVDVGSRSSENIRVYMFGAARILVGASLRHAVEKTGRARFVPLPPA